MPVSTNGGQPRLSRAEKNETAFQSHNERRVALEESGGVAPDEPVPFVCECDDPACSKAVELPLGEYERAVAPVDRFIVAPGHEDPAVEVVVEAHPGYTVVSKPSMRRRGGPAAA
jgi:hypothetical protein